MKAAIKRRRVSSRKIAAIRGRKVEDWTKKQEQAKAKED